MRLGTDATILQSALFGTRQPTPSVEGAQVGMVVTCSAELVKFTLPGFSTQAAFSVPLPIGWPVLSPGADILVLFVRNAFVGQTQIWAIAHT